MHLKPARPPAVLATLLAAIITFPACRRDEPPPPLVLEKKSAVNAQPAPVPLPPKNRPPAPIAHNPIPTNALIDPLRQQPPPNPNSVDAGDASNAPSYLPRSNDCSGWNKRTPVVVRGPADLKQLFSAEHAQRLGRFAVRSAASCAYTNKLADGELTANVLTIEAATPEDAYGLVTCSSSSPTSDRCGGLTRVDQGGGVTFHTWQGRVAIKASIDKGGPAQVAELRRLVQHICGRIQREDAPMLVHALPQESMLPGRLWLVRHLGSLPPQTIAIQPQPNFDEAARALGLGNDTLICIAAYNLPGARQPNTVWIAQYPTPAAARQAFKRTNALAVESPNKAWQHTNVMQPRGPYLIGTWTAEEESMQNIMPKISALLPG